MKREMTCSQQEKQDVNHARGGKSCWYRYSNSNQVSQHRVKIHVSKRHRILVEWRNKAVKSGKSRKTGKTQKNEPWKSNRGRKKAKSQKSTKVVTVRYNPWAKKANFTAQKTKSLPYPGCRGRSRLASLGVVHNTWLVAWWPATGRVLLRSAWIKMGKYFIHWYEILRERGWEIWFGSLDAV